MSMSKNEGPLLLYFGPNIIAKSSLSIHWKWTHKLKSLSHLHRVPHLQTLPSCENANRSQDITRRLRTANIKDNEQGQRKARRNEGMTVGRQQYLPIKVWYEYAVNTSQLGSEWPEESREGLCNLIPGMCPWCHAGHNRGPKIHGNINLLCHKNCIQSSHNVNTIPIFFDFQKLRPRIACWWLSSKIRSTDVFCLANDILKNLFHHC